MLNYEENHKDKEYRLMERIKEAAMSGYPFLIYREEQDLLDTMKKNGTMPRILAKENFKILVEE